MREPEPEPEVARTPKQVEADINKSLLRLALVGIGVLCVLYLVTVSFGIALLRGQSNVLHHIETTATGHRARNEDIHSCLIQKQDAFRRDIHNLLLTKPGAVPVFPDDDGLVCPPINPITGQTEPPPFRPPSTTTTGTTTTTTTVTVPGR